MSILEICKNWGMTNPNDIRHWMEDIDNEVDRLHELKTQELNIKAIKRIKELDEYLEKINFIMWESHMVTEKGIQNKDCTNIMEILEKWADDTNVKP